MTVKEIQAGYLVSSYFKDLYQYLAQNKLPNWKTAIQKVQKLAERYIYIIRFFIIQNYYRSQEIDSIISYTGGIYRQDNYTILF